MTRVLQAVSSASLIALIFVCLAWELRLAPLRPGGSALALKVLPLLLPLFGVLRGRRYTYQWASILILGYFTEAVVRAWSERGMSQVLAAAEMVLSIVFFTTAIFYVRVTGTPVR